MVYQEPPEGMTRMRAVRETVPGAYVMDTGAAAVLGALGDPAVARTAADEGAILVNVGNMHTFACLVKGWRLFGRIGRPHRTPRLLLEWPSPVAGAAD